MKKYGFKQQVKEAHQAILKDNETWYENLVDSQFSGNATETKTPKRNIKALWLTLSSAVAAVLVLVIGLAVGLSKDSTSNKKEKYYMDEDARAAKIEMTQVNSALTNMRFTIDDMYEYWPERLYDSVSGDTLYYRVYMTSDDPTYETVEFEVYTNPDYKDKKILSSDPTPALVHDVPFNYNTTVAEEDGIFTIEYRALLEYKGISFYVTYQQMSLDENSNFFHFLEQIIEFK